MNRAALLALGAAAAIAETALWHGPVGTSERLSASIERSVRTELDHFEMNAISAGIDRSPLSRTVILSGPANDFQQKELVRIIGDVPGVAKVHWAGATNESKSGRAMPLLLEATLMSLVGFLLGLLFSYLVELRRRASADDDRRW